MAAFIREIGVATTLSPPVIISTEREPSPIDKALIEFLKPTFIVRSEVGDYVYAPYGESEGSWLIPFLLLGFTVWCIHSRFFR